MKNKILFIIVPCLIMFATSNDNLFIRILLGIFSIVLFTDLFIKLKGAKNGNKKKD